MPSHSPIPTTHPVTGEPVEELPKVIKKNGTGAYTTRGPQTEIGEPDQGANVVEKLPTRQGPMSAAQIRESQKASEPKPIKLTYKYEGTCPTCVTPIHTLLMDVARKLVAVAYCPTCGKNVEDQTVRRLEVKPVERKEAQTGKKTSKGNRKET